MKKRLFSLNATFTLLQVITVLLCVLGMVMAYIPVNVGVHALMDGPAVFGFSHGQWLTLLIVGFTAVITVSLCCACALIAFFLMCGRLKQGSAFTRKNQRTMGFIALCSLTAGVMLICAMGFLCLLHATSVLSLWLVLGAFLFLAVAAVAWALSLLVSRAVSLQEDADLTV